MNIAVQLQKFILVSIVILVAFLGISLTASDANAANPMIVTVKTIVARGEILNASNLKLVEAKSAKIQNGIATEIDEIEGLEALRNLRPGVSIRVSFLRERPLVRKNKQAKAKFNKPGILLESDVMVLQDGYKSDIVKVKNLKSNQTFNAEVVDNNLVIVK